MASDVNDRFYFCPVLSPMHERKELMFISSIRQGAPSNDNIACLVETLFGYVHVWSIQSRLTVENVMEPSQNLLWKERLLKEVAFHYISGS